MKKILSVCVALALVCLLPALAAGVEITGTVVNTNPIQLNALFSGRVDSVSAFEGDYVSKGAKIASVSGTTVYALQDGVVRLFGQEGDNAESVSDTFGAVLYIESSQALTVSASTKNAYNLVKNKIIHPGETVYIRGVNNTKHTGTGYVTNVSGANYTVKLTKGSFNDKESVYIFRDSKYDATTRIGGGTIKRLDPVAYKAEGVISKISVKDGQNVKKGAALFETLSGTYSGSKSSLGSLVSPAAGVIYSLEITRGAALTEGDPVAVIYPDEYLRVQANVTEADLEFFASGTKVNILLINYGDGKTSLTGTVERVSRAGSAGESENDPVKYSVLIKPDTADNLSYGMTSLVSPAE
ncbi:MAG: HlyD family efflux transporter periplasmic adaptor subunit [Clostridiales bacterium]|nr:HlyD family efflux transporter periplasmic adaptor subunit [Clostridiales bacterium]